MERLLIIVIAIAVIVSQMISRARKSQQREQKKEGSPLDILTKPPWEFEMPDNAPTSEERIEERIEVEAHKPGQVRLDEELAVAAHESAVSDEESFNEETIAQKKPPEPQIKSQPAPEKHGPGRIAGIPITPRTIGQGVIISEILKRPKF